MRRASVTRWFNGVYQTRKFFVYFEMASPPFSDNAFQPARAFFSVNLTNAKHFIPPCLHTKIKKTSRIACFAQLLKASVRSAKMLILLDQKRKREVSGSRVRRT